MGIGPLELSGIMSRTQDFATIKQQEDNRNIVNHQNFANQLNKQVNSKVNTVERGNDTNNDQKKFDAKEKGSNEYNGDGGKRRNDQKKNEGVVVKRNVTSSFDIRI